MNTSNARAYYVRAAVIACTAPVLALAGLACSPAVAAPAPAPATATAKAADNGGPSTPPGLPPLRVHANGRALVDHQGRPVFLLADTAWSLAMRANREDVEAYLRHRRGQRFNAVTFVLFAPGKTELVDADRGVHRNAYGDAPFEPAANGKPDPARPVVTPGADPADPAAYDYWNHVDHTIDQCRRLGLYAIVLPTWGSGVTGGHGGDKGLDEIVFDAANAYAYGRWLGDRYKPHKHVVWMLGGDRSAVYGEGAAAKDYRPVFRAMAEGLADGTNGEDRHDGKADYGSTLMSYHPRKAAPQSSAWFHADPWLDFNSIQDWPEAQPPAITKDWGLPPAKPTWLFEGRYEGYFKGNHKPDQWGEWQVRQQAYQTVFAGAFGHTYGHERVFGFGHDKADWKAALDAPGARCMTHLAKLMNGLGERNLLARAPAQDLLDGPAGTAGRVASDRLTATRTAHGGLAMVYSANGRPVRVRTDQFAKGPLFAWWFNPRNGKWSVNGTEADEQKHFADDVPAGPGTATREFDPPGEPGEGNDWVLVLSTGPGM